MCLRGVPSDWKIAISEAITNWNKVNSSINITTQNIKSNLTIVIDSWESNSTQGIANAYMASSTGQPGKAIFINTYFNNLSASKKINAMVHELGHNFGLTHTNELKGTLISCTPLVDYDSVMFPITHEWTGFSVYDNIAISTLYPVAVDAKKLYRYKKINIISTQQMLVK